MRVTRCRTRAGHGVSNTRHVSFSTRSLGRKAGNHGWNTETTNVNTPNTAGACKVKDGASKPCFSEVYRRRCTGGSSSGILRPSSGESRVGPRLNAIQWIPGDISASGHRESRRCREGIQPEENPLDKPSSVMSAASGSSASLEGSASDGDSPEVTYHARRFEMSRVLLTLERSGERPKT